jgi:hypothetical protein
LTSRPRGAAGDQAAAPVRDRENDLRIRNAVAAKLPLHQIIAGQRLAPSSALRTKPSIAFAKRRCGMRFCHVALPAPAMEQRSMMAGRACDRRTNACVERLLAFATSDADVCSCSNLASHKRHI